jgi:hypothetical protein
VNRLPSLQYEKAYDSIMYGQLNKRAAGIAFGNVEVSNLHCRAKHSYKESLTLREWIS